MVRLVRNHVPSSETDLESRAFPQGLSLGTCLRLVSLQIGSTDGENCDTAMTKAQTEDSHAELPNRVTHRIIEAPVTYELAQRDSRSHARGYTLAESKPLNQQMAPQPLALPHVDDLIPRSEHSHPPPHSVTHCRVENATCPPYTTKVSVADLGKSRGSGASFHATTARQSELKPITEARSAKDVPLPPSRLTSLATARGKDRKAGSSSISPKESVSQVSSRRSGKSNRSKHDSIHDSRHGKDHKDGDSRSRTSRK